MLLLDNFIVKDIRLSQMLLTEQLPCNLSIVLLVGQRSTPYFGRCPDEMILAYFEGYQLWVVFTKV